MKLGLLSRVRDLEGLVRRTEARAHPERARPFQILFPILQSNWERPNSQNLVRGPCPAIDLMGRPGDKDNYIF